MANKENRATLTAVVKDKKKIDKKDSTGKKNEKRPVNRENATQTVSKTDAPVVKSKPNLGKLRKAATTLGFQHARPSPAREPNSVLHDKSQAKVSKEPRGDHRSHQPQRSRSDLSKPSDQLKREDQHGNHHNAHDHGHHGHHNAHDHGHHGHHNVHDHGHHGHHNVHDHGHHGHHHNGHDHGHYGHHNAHDHGHHGHHNVLDHGHHGHHHNVHDHGHHAHHHNGHDHGHHGHHHNVHDHGHHGHHNAHDHGHHGHHNVHDHGHHGHHNVHDHGHHGHHHGVHDHGHHGHHHNVHDHGHHGHHHNVHDHGHHGHHHNVHDHGHHGHHHNVHEHGHHGHHHNTHDHGHHGYHHGHHENDYAHQSPHHPHSGHSKKNSTFGGRSRRTYSTISGNHRHYYGDCYSRCSDCSDIAWENTYRIDPDDGVNSDRIRRTMQGVLKERLEGKTYDALEMQLECRAISDIIKDKIKDLKMGRFKLVCLVFIGQERKQSVQIGSRCLWDDRYDTFATATVRVADFYATAMIFATYFE